MIEHLVDDAIASLVAQTGLNTLVGIESDVTDLACPFCVIYSDIKGHSGEKTIHHIETKIEYHSIPGNMGTDDIIADLTSIDQLLEHPTDAQVAAASTDGLSLLVWGDVDSSHQGVGPKRIDSRTITVYAQES